MRTLSRIGLAALALAVAIPVFAGHGEKCNYPTQECLDHMAAQLKISGWVGVELKFDESTGIPTVMKVVPGSPAEAAGIAPGDVFVALNGVKFGKDNEEALMKAKKDWKPGQSVDYTISRNGLDKKVEVTLAPMPADIMAAYIGQHMLEHANMQVAQQNPKK
jgi:C-terminal processing protease CtpA/Prc